MLTAASSSIDVVHSCQKATHSHTMASDCANKHILISSLPAPRLIKPFQLSFPDSVPAHCIRTRCTHTQRSASFHLYSLFLAARGGRARGGKCTAPALLFVYEKCNLTFANKHTCALCRPHFERYIGQANCALSLRRCGFRKKSNLLFVCICTAQGEVCTMCVV